MTRKTPTPKPRARGTGTIRVQGGMFEARWRGNDGREIAQRFPTERAAAEHLDEQLVAKRKAKTTGARYVAPNNLGPTVAEEAEGFMADRAAKGLTPHSLVSYSGVVRGYIIPYFGSRRIGSITVRDIEAFQSWLASKGLAPATCAKAMRTLKPILRRAKRLGHIATNPALDLEPTRSKGRKPKPTMIGLAQLELLASVIDPRHSALVVFAGTTGMRAGEIAEVRWRDLDVVGGWVNVERSVADISLAASKRAGLPSVTPGFHVGPPKNGHSRRTVLLPSVVAMLGEPGAPDDLVFTSTEGERIRWDNWRHRVWAPAIRAAVREAGREALEARCQALGLALPDEPTTAELSSTLREAGEDPDKLALGHGSPPFPPGLRVHDLRHAFVSIAYNEVGLNPRQIAEMSGHRDMATMLNIYLHVFGGWDEKLAERFEAARSTVRLSVVAGAKKGDARRGAA
ncbi:MAG: tyrosine-type recombinase/integrase [Ilumatobacteraceae bacterium]